MVCWCISATQPPTKMTLTCPLTKRWNEMQPKSRARRSTERVHAADEANFAPRVRQPVGVRDLYRCAQRRQRVAGVSEKSRPGERHTDAGLAHSRARPDVGSAAPATKLVRRASQRPFTPVDALNGLSTPRRLHRADRPFIRPPRSAHRDREANGLDQPSAAGMPRAARAKAFSVKDASGSARSANSSASPRACA